MSRQLNIYSKLFGYKAWANAEILTVLRQGTLPDEAQREALEIMEHTYIVDKVFQANMLRRPHDYKSLNAVSTSHIKDLSARISDLDQWNLAYIAALSDDELSEGIAFTYVSDGEPGFMTRGDMLIHVEHHSLYHRGNVGQIFSSHGIARPQDTFSTYHDLTRDGFRPLIASLRPKTPQL